LGKGIAFLASPSPLLLISTRRNKEENRHTAKFIMLYKVEVKLVIIPLVSNLGMMMYQYYRRDFSCISCSICDVQTDHFTP